MFFTTYKFVFLFLPVTLVVFLALLRRDRADLAVLWLMACSMVFFGSLDKLGLAVICASVVVNYFISALICRWRPRHQSIAFWALFTGVSLNIALLGYLKYFAAWFDVQPQLVPLGISFYSLMQIAYLVNTYGESPVQPAFPKYFLYITFFPYVVAGPILTRKEHLDQFDGLSLERCRLLFLSGLFAFALGLVKKVGIADSLAPYVSAVHAGVSNGVLLSSADAWTSALMYPLQLYFDFSGYSDMAAGLAAMFGIRVMRNFHSPLKAISMIDFWSRWHISMSRFFRNHVFMMIAIRTMRFALKHRIAGFSQYALTTLGPMIVTFLLIGIWHGAGANFVVFGLLMGVAVSINHLWRKFSLPKPPVWLGWLLTMMVFVVALVFIRSSSFADAMVLLGAMLGLGADSAGAMIDHLEAWLLIIVLGIVVTSAPNSHELLVKYPIVLEESALNDGKPESSRLSWAPTGAGVVVAGLMLAAGISLIVKANQFIYYRF